MVELLQRFRNGDLDLHVVPGVRRKLWRPVLRYFEPTGGGEGPNREEIARFELELHVEDMKFEYHVSDA